MAKAPTPLEQRTLGRTGGAMTILGLGTRRLAAASQQGAIRLVREAIDAGVNVLEVAPEYGDGRTERWIGLALRDGYRERVQLIWQCCAHLRDYKTAMAQFEATLGHLRTDRIEMWSFHEVIYDNDPDWIYEHGGLDAAQEAREQRRVRWIAFHGEKSPHIALKLLQRGFAFDGGLQEGIGRQMHAHPADFHLRRGAFQHQGIVKTDADDTQSRHRSGQISTHLRVEFLRTADAQVKAGQRFGGMKIGRGFEEAKPAAQLLHQREQTARQYQTLVHVHNLVALDGVKTDFTTRDLERGAAARMGRHDDGRQHFGGDTGLHQGVLDGSALACRIVGRGKVLQRTAAARTEMATGLTRRYCRHARHLPRGPEPSTRWKRCHRHPGRPAGTSSRGYHGPGRYPAGSWAVP